MNTRMRLRARSACANSLRLWTSYVRIVCGVEPGAVQRGASEYGRRGRETEGRLLQETSQSLWRDASDRGWRFSGSLGCGAWDTLVSRANLPRHCATGVLLCSCVTLCRQLVDLLWLCSCISTCFANYIANSPLYGNTESEIVIVIHCEL